jgi:FdhD protein
VREVRQGAVTGREDRLATEEPLEIRLAWPGRPAHRMSVTMRTPGSDFELAAGFLFAERVIAGAGDLHTIAYCTDHTITAEEEFNVVTVELAAPPRRPPGSRYDGPAGAVSACGVCGKQSIDDVLHSHDSTGVAVSDAVGARWTGLEVPAAVLVDLPDRMRSAQRVFDKTGGIHAAGLFDEKGELRVVREDIGRHNAVDKVVGSRLLAGEETAVPLLCVSGRIGFELVQKAVVAGIGVLAAVGAPSSLAVALAAEAGLCTVGFLRGERFVVYTAPERIGV